MSSEDLGGGGALDSAKKNEETGEQSAGTDAMATDSGEAASGGPANSSKADPVDTDEQPGGEAEAEPSADGPEQAVDGPEQLLEAAQEQALAAKERMLRVAADFENFKKRSRREAKESVLQAENRAVLEFLPIMDNLERAIDHAQAGEGDVAGSLIDGVKMVQKQFLNALARYEIAQVLAVGEVFDPELHEALQQAPSDEPRNTVIVELQKGYRRGERLVRPAMVVVSKGPDVEANAKSADAEEADASTAGTQDAGSDGVGDEGPKSDEAAASSDGPVDDSVPKSEAEGAEEST